MHILNDATAAGLTIDSMSLDAKYVMLDELQFHQYIFALQDGDDKNNAIPKQSGPTTG